MPRWTTLLFTLLLAGAGQAADLAENLDGLEWREVGPYRGGRSAAVTGIPQKPDTYYFGATGGGVWKTSDGGKHWNNVSDGFFGGSIGAVAVSEWDPNVVYVGTGEKTVRGNVSHGNGVWKSTDAGDTWSHVGLPDTRHIPRVRVHPRDPDTVYVAALGHLFGPDEQRGVFRSTDGGESWEKVLYINDEVGVVDLVMDPTNPRVLYATTWRIKRTPYSLESGGPDSGVIWKTTDGGDNWQSLADNEGLPEPPLGIAGITVSPSNPDNLYAIIEADDGGVFRSTDAGETWTRTNKQRKLRQRAWYYTRIYAAPKDEDVVYVVNVRFHKSRDGGRTFEAIPTPHGDNHDLWIAPDDPDRMIEANDGGANVSYDGGETWSAQDNQPTAQMYRVSTDNDFPYRLLGGQQDNSAIGIRSQAFYRDAIGKRNWRPTAGGESGHITAKPDNPDIVYGGSYGGYLIRVNHDTGARRAVNVWPNNPMGWGAAELKYRFNWNYPLQFSRHDHDRLYAAANVLFRTTNGGQSWEKISPDLTRNIKDKQGPSGGPITKDNTSVEYYGTIFALAESRFDGDVLWTGSDDGLVHITRDGGESWQDVTPRGLPREIQVNSLEPHPFEAGGAYLAATRYKQDDFRPYLYKTTDYGQSWTRIDDGIAADHFTRVLRADPQQRGLLFAGTEKGLYISRNDGDDWQALQLNLPISPVTDLEIKRGDLIAATQGRGYWILDHLNVLRQANPDAFGDAPVLFEPSAAHRLKAGHDEDPGHRGENPPDGVVFHYWLPEAPAEDTPVELTLLEPDADVIRSYTRKPDDDAPGDDDNADQDDNAKLPAEPGINRFTWNLHYPEAEDFEGMVLWNSDLSGPRAVPGRYKARLEVGDWSDTVDVEVEADPRLDTTPEAYRAQFDFVQGIATKLTETHNAIARIDAAKAQIDAVAERVGDEAEMQPLVESGEALKQKLTDIQTALHQTKAESRQDPLNYPIRLNDKLAGVKNLAQIGDNRPTDSMIEVRDELVAAIDAELASLEELWQSDLAAYNEQARELGLDAVTIER